MGKKSRKTQGLSNPPVKNDGKTDFRQVITRKDFKGESKKIIVLEGYQTEIITKADTRKSHKSKYEQKQGGSKTKSNEFGQYRRFRGTLYVLHGKFNSQSSAKKSAEGLRHGGKLARVVEGNSGWGVYIAPKR